MKDNDKDKIAFVIAFLGVVIALSPFAKTLKTINIDYGFKSINILTFAYLSLGLLFLSIYFYALDYIRYGFKIFDRITILRYFKIIGDFFYLLAILSPFIYLLIWIIIKAYILIPLPQIDLKKHSYLISSILSISATIISIYAAWSQNKEQRKAKEELLDNSSVTSENEVKNLVVKRLWSLSIIEAFRSLELSIDKKLIELGIDHTRITTFRAIDILLKNEVINKKDYNHIQYIRDARNRAAHSSIEFTEDEAQEVINSIKEILPKLETSVTKYKYIEKKVLAALVGKNGLFPKHLLSIEADIQDKRFDALGQGPDYEYLIEIKLSKNPTVISQSYKYLSAHIKEKQRGLIVVPYPIPKIELDESNIKVLLYDIDQDIFINRAIIYDWIYRNI